MADPSANEQTAIMADPGAIQLIAPAGNVILVVGGEEPFTRLRVSSAALSMASGAFVALLGPKFRECRADGSSQSPIEINFPDDDGTAMSDMCHLHLQQTIGFTPNVPRHRVYQFAVVVDKYFCARALRLLASALLLHHIHAISVSENDTDEDMVVDLMAAAYMLDDADSFGALGKILILSYRRPFSELRRQTESARRLPLRLYLHLEETRSAARQTLISSIAELGTTQSSVPCCRWANHNWGKTLRLHLPDRYSTWPPDFQRDALVIEDLLRKIVQLGVVRCEEHQCAYAAHAPLFESVAQKVRTECRMPCLKCVKEEDREDTGTGPLWDEHLWLIKR